MDETGVCIEGVRLMTAKTLMVQGTTSDAGKSLLVTALCRWLWRQGVQVAPFKPQNMSLNSAVTIDGGEIGRAQAVQAAACELPAHSDMNPVLLKPNSDHGAQVIVQGRVVSSLDASAYQDYKQVAMQAVLQSHARLAAQYQVVVCEGAGSPAEINLRRHDIANMGFAEAVNCPVILVADIDRGGVFAHVVGTLALLSETERARVRGVVINRFRGDLSLLQPGLDWLEHEIGIPVLGVLPYMHDLYLDAEDALPRLHAQNGGFRVVVPALPRISNHTDFDALRLHPGVSLLFAAAGKPLPGADLICLPGSKSVRDDLAWLRRHGWEADLLRHLRYGGKVLGICGGFQMLGRTITDPNGIEGLPGQSVGIGLLDVDTVLEPEKQLRRVRGRLAWSGATVSGYEIHAGVTSGPGLNRPAIVLDHGVDGAISLDGSVMGTYLHGCLDESSACDAILAWAGYQEANATSLAVRRELDLNRLADAVDAHLDTARLRELLY